MELLLSTFSELLYNMRDLKLFYEEEIGFDIEIEDGYPVDVDKENQTADQRAAVGAIFVKGTLPGQPEFGVSWGELYTKEASLMAVSNEVQETVQSVSGGDGQASNVYMPLFVPTTDGKVSVTVVKGEAL